MLCEVQIVIDDDSEHSGSSAEGDVCVVDVYVEHFGLACEGQCYSFLWGKSEFCRVAPFENDL